MKNSNSDSKKLFHLHLEDSMGNKTTLVCRLDNGSIRYVYYGGTGSSGTPCSLSNIQFYTIENGDKRFDRNLTPPVENEEGESIEQFKQRVIKMLNNSTDRVIHIVNTDVSFS